MQRGSEDRKRSLSQLRWALQNKETQQKFVRSALVMHCMAVIKGMSRVALCPSHYVGELVCG